LSSLSFYISRGELGPYSDLQRAVYCALASKFMAESASDVGKSTFLVILSNDDRDPLEFIASPGIEEIRELWNRRGIPKVPIKSIDQLIPNLVHKNL
jgi:hypothetical protein